MATISALERVTMIALMLYVGFLVLLMVTNLGYIRWEAFAYVFRSADLRYAIRLSLITASISAVLSLIVAIPAGFALSRFRFPGIRLLDAIADIPLILSHLVVGLTLLVFFQSPLGRFIENHGMRFVYAPAGIVLAQFTVVSAFALRTLKATFDGVDPRMENVARTLGWSRLQTFLRVTLPVSRNGIMAAAVFAWAQAIGLFGPLMVFAGTTRRSTEVMATAIYLELSVGNLEEAIAISMIMIVLAFATLALVKWLAAGKYWW